MIKTRLLKLLKGSGKYIGANIFWQWIALLFQIAAVFAAGNMIQQLFEKTLDQQVMLQTAGIVILAICAHFEKAYLRILKCLLQLKNLLLLIFSLSFPLILQFDYI